VFRHSKLVVRQTRRIAEAVTDLSLDWLTGDIYIHPGDNEDIVIVQLAEQKFPEKKLFRYYVDNGKLSIVDGRKEAMQIGFNLHKTALEIHLPKKQLHSIKLSSVGSHVTAHHLHAVTCRYSMTSGTAKLSGQMEELNLHLTGSHVTGEELNVGKLNLQATASRIELTGTFSRLNARLTGRSFNIRSSTELHTMDSVSTGANVTVKMPESEGFILQLKKRSGHFKSAFPLSQEGKTYTYKNGKGTYNAEIRGGSFALCRV
jgi:hypothetical protein